MESAGYIAIRANDLAARIDPTWKRENRAGKVQCRELAVAEQEAVRFAGRVPKRSYNVALRVDRTCFLCQRCPWNVDRFEYTAPEQKAMRSAIRVQEESDDIALWVNAEWRRGQRAWKINRCEFAIVKKISPLPAINVSVATTKSPRAFSSLPPVATAPGTSTSVKIPSLRSQPCCFPMLSTYTPRSHHVD